MRMPVPILSVFIDEIAVLRARENLNQVHVLSVGSGNMKRKDYAEAIKNMTRDAGMGAEEEEDVKRSPLTKEKAKDVLSWLGDDADDDAVEKLTRIDKKRFEG